MKQPVLFGSGGGGGSWIYTIAVTAPSGASITVSGGGETLTGTGTGSNYAFQVHNQSTQYTISVTMDGNTKTDSVTTGTATGAISFVVIEFGTINVTVDAAFVTAGSTITCAMIGYNTISKPAASSLTFRVPSTGTWTISGEISGTPYSKEAVVSSLSVPVNAELQTKAPMYSFETATDAQLAAMLDSYYRGLYDATDIATLKSTYMPIGAKRTIHLNAMSATGVSETHHADDYEFVIIDQEHDDLQTTSSGGKTKALLTLQMDRILYSDITAANYSSQFPAVAEEGGYMNSTATNEGGWNGCARNTWCNDVFLNSLPLAIKSLVKTVNKYTSAGNQLENIIVSSDKVFLLSEIEIFGEATYSVVGEGSQYYYFRTTTNRYKKPSFGSSTSAYWRERSPYKGNSTHFCYVSNTGAANYYGFNAGAAAGIAPAFCI